MEDFSQIERFTRKKQQRTLLNEIRTKNYSIIIDQKLTCKKVLEQMNVSQIILEDKKKNKVVVNLMNWDNNINLTISKIN